MLFWIGEGAAAFNGKKSDTFSERFDRLPSPAKFALIGLMGAVFGHLVWQLPTPEITVEGDLNVDVHSNPQQ